MVSEEVKVDHGNQGILSIPLQGFHPATVPEIKHRIHCAGLKSTYHRDAFPVKGRHRQTVKTDKESNDLRDVYWTLETDQASDADYRRIVDQRLSKPYPDFGSSMTQIREEKQIGIAELSRLSGLPEDILAEAESGKLELTGEDLEAVQRVYWALSALEASPAEYRRLLAEMGMKANED